MRLLRLSLCVLALTFGAASVSAQAPDGGDSPSDEDKGAQQGTDADGAGTGDGGEDKGSKGKNKNEAKTPPYAKKVQAGIRLILARDNGGAIHALREAVELDSKKPDAHYYMGVARRKNDEPDKALESFREAVRTADRAGAPRFRGRALIGIADTLQRRARTATEELEEPGLAVEAYKKAREAWNDVLRFAETHGDVVERRLPKTQLNVIDKVIEQEKKYVDVRKRIAERKAKKEKEKGGDGEEGEE